MKNNKRTADVQHEWQDSFQGQKAKHTYRKLSWRNLKYNILSTCPANFTCNTVMAMYIYQKHIYEEVNLHNGRVGPYNS